MDRWSLQNLATEAPIKKYALIVIARALGGLQAFGGLTNFISANPNKEMAHASHKLKNRRQVQASKARGENASRGGSIS